MAAPHLAKRYICISAASAASMMLVTANYCIKKRSQRRRKARSPTLRRKAIALPISTTILTPWRRVLLFGDDKDFLASVNFTKAVFFDRLLPKFALIRGHVNYGSPYRTKPKTRGRNALIDTTDLLGMALWYLKSRTTSYQLTLIFGLVPSSFAVWLDSLEVLFKVVTDTENTDCEIRWPTVDEMKEYNLLLKQNRNLGELLNGVFAVTDGGRLPCADYTDLTLQNAYFEGFTQAVEVTNLFVWNFSGELIHAAVNFPGSWHDNKVAGTSGLYFPKLSYVMTPPGYAILGDSAFVNDTRVAKGKAVHARKSNETRDIPESAVLSAIDAVLQKVMPSERQSAEWGVRAIKGPFARLNNPLPADSKKRRRMITICCHLFNLGIRFVGFNQIRTTYSQAQDNRSVSEE